MPSIKQWRRKKMVDINLHQASESDLRINKRKSVVKSGSFISFALLFFILVLYGITILYQSSLNKKNSNLILEKQQALNSFDSLAINKIADFQYRAENVSFNLNNKKNPESTLSLIEKFVVKGTILNSLSYDSTKNSIEIEAVADSFRLAANQILSFKKSDLFSDVKIVESGRNKDNQAVFKIEADFKNDISLK